jgi:hypothetical protein
MISFVIIYHPCRENNLNQTLRFLAEREPKCLSGELITVCQTSGDRPKSSFLEHQHYNLEINTYKKPLLCNFGVSKAKHQIVALIDSDRILPRGYFERNAKLVGETTFVTTLNLIKLSKEASDAEINAGQYEFWNDFRCRDNAMFSKNMFAGNTLMRRDHYLSLGGMSDEFVGYGFSDTDMTMKAIKSNSEMIYVNELELHLWHPRNIDWEGQNLTSDTFKIITAINALIYCNKWRLFVNLPMVNHQKTIESSLSSFPKSLVDKYLDLKSEYFEWSKRYHLL